MFFATGGKMTTWKRWLLCGIAGTVASMPVLMAQESVQPGDSSGTPIVLTLRRAVELALQNSKDIQLARIQTRVADQSANLTKSEFKPNLYAGSGAGYTYGIPETPGGRAPSVFNVPLRGLAKEQQEQAKAQRVLLEETRSSVILRVATAYLELVKVHHALD